MAQLPVKEDIKKIIPKIEKDAPISKSSTEILSELFGVFNAKPPEISYDIKKTKVKTKKLKKKSKHKEKKKKKSDKRGRSSSDSETSIVDISSHKKKSKKNKHKKRKRKTSDSGSDYKSSHASYFPDPKDYAKDYLESVSMLEKVTNNRKVTVTDSDHYTIQVNNESITPEKPRNARISDHKISESKNNYPMDNIPIPKMPDVSQIKLPEEKNHSNKAKSNPPPPENIDKGKSASNKIQIKNLKFSSVFEANVKQAEEEARKKAEKHAEKYEEGELSENSNDNSVFKLSSESESGSDPNKTPDLRDKLNEISSTHKKMRSDSKSTDNNKKIEKKSRRSSSRSRKRSRSRSPKRSHSKSRKRTRSRSRSKRSHSRERSSRYDKYDDRSRPHRQERRRSKSRDKRMEIDKKRLLEIARKNAITMLQTGTLPAASTLGPQAQQKVISAIKSGGKSVDELTDFCKNLSRQEALGELSSVSSDSDNENERDLHDSEARPFHHPFQVKDKAPIVLNIKGGTPLPTQSFQEKTIEQSKVLRLQFPVSSGTHHRGAESEWKPVSPPSSSSSTSANKNSSPVLPLPKHVPIPSPFTKKTQPPAPLALPPLPPALPPIHSVELAKPPQHQHNNQPTIHSYGEVASLPEYNNDNNFNQTAAEVYPQPVLPGPRVFPAETNANYDIGSIVSQRLTAIRKLQQNPNDSSAMNQMYHANQEMSKWAQSKQEPGQFTGSTGANILTPRELASGYQAWAKRDQLQTAAPVSGGMGMHLLQKMGWRPGEGLGKEKNGALTPIMLEVKLDTRGLVAKEETRQRNNVRRAPVATVKTLAGKHPVSLLGEFCSKRKLGVPSYTLCFECGPDHKKNFLFKVTVDGVEYKPSVASANKKQAKADAAQICLQKLGLLS